MVRHWEADALVIDSTNFKGKGWLVLGGDFFTEAAHLEDSCHEGNADLVHLKNVHDIARGTAKK